MLLRFFQIVVSVSKTPHAQLVARIDDRGAILIEFLLRFEKRGYTTRRSRNTNLPRRDTACNRSVHQIFARPLTPRLQASSRSCDHTPRAIRPFYQAVIDVADLGEHQVRVVLVVADRSHGRSSRGNSRYSRRIHCFFPGISHEKAVQRL